MAWLEKRDDRYFHTPFSRKWLTVLRRIPKFDIYSWPSKIRWLLWQPPRQNALTGSGSENFRFFFFSVCLAGKPSNSAGSNHLVLFISSVGYFWWIQSSLSFFITLESLGIMGDKSLLDTLCTKTYKEQGVWYASTTYLPFSKHFRFLVSSTLLGGHCV